MGEWFGQDFCRSFFELETGWNFVSVGGFLWKFLGSQPQDRTQKKSQACHKWGYLHRNYERPGLPEKMREFFPLDIRRWNRPLEKTTKQASGSLALRCFSGCIYSWKPKTQRVFFMEGNGETPIFSVVITWSHPTGRTNFTLPKTNSLPLKMLASNRNLSFFPGGPHFQGAFNLLVSFRGKGPNSWIRFGHVILLGAWWWP